MSITKPVLAIDCDDVLLHYVPAVAEWHNQVYGTQLSLSDFTSFQFSQVWGGDSASTLDKVNLFSTTEEYKQLKCIEGAKSALEQLHQHVDLIVITARFPDRAQITQQWLDSNFPGLITKVYYTFDKASVCEQLNAYAIIDDSASNIAKCQHVVQKAILFDHEQSYLWNKDTCNLDPNKFVRAHSWQEVVNILIPSTTIHSSRLK
jgi:5'(3')-deoxyribonucleotidase